MGSDATGRANSRPHRNWILLQPMKATALSGDSPSTARLHCRLGPPSLVCLATLALSLSSLAGAENRSGPIPFSAIGAKATADYQGDALGTAATTEGARLWCGFQKLQGRATSQGLWLESTAPGGGEFRLMATAVCRTVVDCGGPSPLSDEPGARQSGADGSGPQSTMLARWCPRLDISEGIIPTTGMVSAGKSWCDSHVLG